MIGICFTVIISSDAAHIAYHTIFITFVVVNSIPVVAVYFTAEHVTAENAIFMFISDADAPKPITNWSQKHWNKNVFKSKQTIAWPQINPSEIITASRL